MSDQNEEKKKQILELLQHRDALERDSELKNIVFTPIQEAFLLRTSKIGVLSGANQSGKSTAGAADLLMRSGQGIPDQLKGKFNEKFVIPGEYWATALDFPSSYEVQQKKLKDLAPRRMIARENKEPRFMEFHNGAVIGFKSAESGWEKFQGAVKDGLWNDEEIKQEIFNEQYMRSIAKQGWISMTFSPIKGLTWAYERIWKKAKRYVFTENIHDIKEGVGIVHTLEEIKLLRDRRVVCRNNTDLENVDPNIEAFQMAIYDNPHISDIEIQNTERLFKEDIPNYNSRILGGFTKLVGKNVFAIEPLLKMQNTCPTKYERGDIVNGQWKDSLRGHLVIFKQKKPGHFYIVGGDPSAGLDTGDPTCIQVIDHMTCEQVAIWHGKCNPDEFGSILIDIGRYFNTAWICPETNFHGFGVIKRIRDHKYPALFSEYDVPSETVKVNNVTSMGQKRYGWHTNAKTKPLMIQELQRFVAEGRIKINDPATIDELITYIYDNHGHTNALRGCKDDRVMALAICVQVKIRKAPRRIALSGTSKPTNRTLDKRTGYSY